MSRNILTETVGAGNSTVNALQSSAVEVWGQFAAFFPLLIAAIVVLIVGWGLIKVVQFLTARILRICGVNKLASKMKINDFLAKAHIEMTLADIIAKIVYYLSLIVVFKTVVQVLRLHEVTDALDHVLGFVTTNVLSAAIIVGVGLYVGNMVKNVILNIGTKAKFKHTNFMANASHIAIIVFVSIPALARLGIDPSIFQDNITILIAGIALAIGLGGRDTAKKIIDSVYEKFSS